MPFKFSESHIADYMSEGYVIFRSAIPPSLIADLRKVADKAREIAREKIGPQAQRLQPVSDYDLDLRPFHDYAQLPDLNHAVKQVIGPDAWYCDVDSMPAILLEPAQAPWCTSWHRDITAATPGVDAEEFNRVQLRLDFFNQVNCALYDDSSAWFVPGSHLRADVAGETEHVPKCPTKNWQGIPDGSMTHEELETANLDYARGMPRAICMQLGAGDFGLYRPLGWHLGNYVPYRIRATIHDTVWGKDVKDWYARWEEARKP